MARITAGIGCSRVPAIGAAVDHDKTGEPYWAPLFAGFEKTCEWIAAEKPDVVILVYNDHASAFDLRVIPTFAIGCAERFEPADEGWGPRRVPAVQGAPELSWHIAESLILDEFDITIANHLDVGIDVWPTGKLARESDSGGCQRHPVPSADRQSLLSIRPRAGLINSEFDRDFLDRLTNDPLGLAARPHLDYTRLAGSEGIELVMWMVMRGALGDRAEELHRFYHVPASNTAVGHIVLRPVTDAHAYQLSLRARSR